MEGTSAAQPEEEEAPTGGRTAGAEQTSGKIAEKKGGTMIDAAKEVAGRKVGPIDGKEAEPPTTRIGAGRTQPLGGSRSRTKLEAGPGSPDLARRRAEDAGTSASGTVLEVQDRDEES